MRRFLLLAGSHAVVLVLGFALGIYVLPILVAPPSPSASAIAAATGPVRWTATLRRGLADSDALHWGDGTVTIGPRAIGFVGRLAPGPDYKLYLSPAFVETEAEFLRLKPRMARVGDIRSFTNFVVVLPQGVDLEQYTSVVVWCETFGQFISAGRYR